MHPLHLPGLNGAMHVHSGKLNSRGLCALTSVFAGLFLQRDVFKLVHAFALLFQMSHKQNDQVKGFCAGLGYQITAVAATPDQTAAVLSIPRQRTTQNLQEIKHTLRFPSASINKQYIAGIAYGRTVS